MTIDGREYRTPCQKCRDKNCYGCAFQKIQEVLKSEQEKLCSAEYRIETELVPRIEQEKRCYDLIVSYDRAAEWCNHFTSLVDDLLDAFDEDFVETLDFDDDDIECQVARLILDYKRKDGEDDGKVDFCK